MDQSKQTTVKKSSTEAETAMDTSRKMPLAIENFVLHWGEMGTRWGVNRSVAQVHALLYVSTSPLTAEDISEKLGLARSNVSNSLKELLTWQLIRRVHVMGDRRDHFAAETDLWEMLMRIAMGRKHREIDPTIEMMKQCVAEASSDSKVEPLAKERINEMLQFLVTMDNWYTDMATVPKSKMFAMMKMGKTILKFVGIGQGKAKPNNKD